MIRMWRTALLTALGLLVFTASAHAACAWLLWSTYETNRTEHAIQRAFDTQRACEDAIPAAVQQHLRVWRGPYETVNVSPVDAAVVIARGLPDSPRKQAEGDTLLISVSCWPLGLRKVTYRGNDRYAVWVVQEGQRDELNWSTRLWCLPSATDPRPRLPGTADPRVNEGSR